uniref:cGMP-dependent protein kinase n=1 Tax=Mastacembelus armatus TaxID=205130 RepID=A0A7N8XVI8_9TELE
MGTLRDLQFALQLKIEELRQRDRLIDELELELDTKDELIRRLQEELDRYRATVSLPGPSSVSAGAEHDKQRAQRKTVISEPFTLDPVTLSMVSQRSYDKSQASQRLIQAAFLKNDLLRNLDEGEIRSIIACMYPVTISRGCYIIQEGTNGTQAYVLEEGRLEVTKNGIKLLTVEPEGMFGELALIYNCTHSYSVSGSFGFLTLHFACRYHWISVPPKDGQSFIEINLDLVGMHYTEGDYIIRQGATGDTFYIISKGQVKVTEKKPGQEEQIVLAKLSERQWFGEKALWGEDVRTVNVIAAGEVSCLVIDREFDKDYALLSSSTLRDFHIIGTLAVGEFGHVDLVQLRSNTKCLFAMRVLKKKLILNNGQQEHILREGRILTDAHCPFIVRCLLHKTFRDNECLYILTEACLGGDLCSLLKDKGFLDECTTRFYTACVFEALTFLHCRGVIYRDVKPENVVLDEHGYAKLIGSRCLKRVEMGQKTWTFCGTPGYAAPEIILNKGHTISADFWSLGVFVFELLSGGLPFSSSDPMKILTATIRGIDQINFPKTISKSASSLIKKLCRSNPSERLGSLKNEAKDVQKHKWFEGFNWDGLCKRTLNPPLTPRVKHPLDSSASGHYSEDSVDQCTNWDDF